MPPAALPVIAAVGVGVSAVGTAASISQQKKAAKAANKANEYERQRNDLADARQRADAIRAARIAYASSSQAAENQGVSGSSASLGGLGSIQSQLGTNLSFLDQTSFLNDQASKQIGISRTASSRASMWSSVADAGLTVAQNADIFKKKASA